jgi:hypothetical protein
MGDDMLTEETAGHLIAAMNRVADALDRTYWQQKGSPIGDGVVSWGHASPTTPLLPGEQGKPSRFNAWTPLSPNTCLHASLTDPLCSHTVTQVTTTGVTQASGSISTMEDRLRLGGRDWDDYSF